MFVLKAPCVTFTTVSRPITVVTLYRYLKNCDWQNCATYSANCWAIYLFQITHDIFSGPENSPAMKDNPASSPFKAATHSRFDSRLDFVIITAYMFFFFFFTAVVIYLTGLFNDS